MKDPCTDCHITEIINDSEDISEALSSPVQILTSRPGRNSQSPFENEKKMRDEGAKEQF